MEIILALSVIFIIALDFTRRHHFKEMNMFFSLIIWSLLLSSPSVTIAFSMWICMAILLFIFVALPTGMLIYIFVEFGKDIRK